MPVGLLLLVSVPESQLSQRATYSLHNIFYFQNIFPYFFLFSVNTKEYLLPYLLYGV